MTTKDSRWQTRPIVVHHANCNDGLASAWIADRALRIAYFDYVPGMIQIDNVLHYGGEYGDERLVNAVFADMNQSKAFVPIDDVIGSIPTAAKDPYVVLAKNLIDIVDRVKHPEKFGGKAHAEPIDFSFPLFFVDFCLPQELIIYLADTGLFKVISVLDHHPKAIKLWSEQKKVEDRIASGTGLSVSVNINECGATLTWLSFRNLLDAVSHKKVLPDWFQEFPEMLRYIRDRDLWQKALFQTEQIHAALNQTFQLYRDKEYTLGMLFSKLDEIASLSNEEFLGRFALEGQEIFAERCRYVRERVDAAEWIMIAGYKIPCTEYERCHSDIGHMLCSVYPDYPFAAIWKIDQTGNVNISLRSTPQQLKVKPIAERFGGGGHEYAAGFQVDRAAFDAMLEAAVNGAND